MIQFHGWVSNIKNIYRLDPSLISFHSSHFLKLPIEKTVKQHVKEEIGLSIWFFYMPGLHRFELESEKKKEKQYLSNHDLIVVICSINIWCIKEGNTLIKSFLYNWASSFMGEGCIIDPRKPCTSQAQSRNLQRKRLEILSEWKWIFSDSMKPTKDYSTDKRYKFSISHTWCLVSWKVGNYFSQLGFLNSNPWVIANANIRWIKD